VVVFKGLSEFPHTGDVLVTRAVAEVFRDGQSLGEVYPRRDLYSDGQPMTIPGVHSSIEDDVYVLLVSWEPIATDGATFKVYVNPLVNWVWAGGIIFILGTLVATWPDKEEERRAVLTAARSARA
jgi:cytochrome c-type biogenesis protein CcmF